MGSTAWPPQENHLDGPHSSNAAVPPLPSSEGGRDRSREQISPRPASGYNPTVNLHLALWVVSTHMGLGTDGSRGEVGFFLQTKANKQGGTAGKVGVESAGPGGSTSKSCSALSWGCLGKPATAMAVREKPGSCKASAQDLPWCPCQWEVGGGTVPGAAASLSPWEQQQQPLWTSVRGHTVPSVSQISSWPHAYPATTRVTSIHSSNSTVTPALHKGGSTQLGPATPPSSILQCAAGSIVLALCTQTDGEHHHTQPGQQHTRL